MIVNGVCINIILTKTIKNVFQIYFLCSHLAKAYFRSGVLRDFHLRVFSTKIFFYFNKSLNLAIFFYTHIG